MAGTVGFEPTHAEIKTQSLTTWRRPNNYNVLISTNHDSNTIINAVQHHYLTMLI